LQGHWKSRGHDDAEFLVTDVVIMGIVIIGIVADLFDLLMRYIERLLVPWKGKV
jgi:taurine transport system permease protein